MELGQPAFIWPTSIKYQSRSAAVFEICFEKKTSKSVVGTLKNICTGVVHYWYIKVAFAGFCQQIFEKK